MLNYVDSFYNNNSDKFHPERVNGTVILRFVCSKEGIAEEIKVLKEKPKDCGFGEEAVKAIKLARFTPGKDNKGNTVAVKMKIPIRFGPKKEDP